MGRARTAQRAATTRHRSGRSPRYEADFFGIQKNDVLTPIREHYHGTVIGNMGYTKEEGNAAIAEGKADAIAFGVPFLANPDLPARLQAGAVLNQPDPATFYSPGPKGYTDYPAMGWAEESGGASRPDLRLVEEEVTGRPWVIIFISCSRMNAPFHC